MSNKLDYLYRRIFLNSMENLIYTTKEIGFEVSKNPTFFTVAPPPHPRTGCQSQVLTSTEAQMFHWAFS